MKRYVLPAVLCASVLSACSGPQKTLLVDSYPPGATVVEDSSGNRYITPATIPYQVNSEYVDAEGCLRVQSLTVVWPSGANRSLNGGLRFDSAATYLSNIDLSAGGTALDTTGLKPLKPVEYILLCGERDTWALAVERPDVPGLEYDRAAGRRIEIRREIDRRRGERTFNRGMGEFACALAGNGRSCSRSADYRYERPRHRDYGPAIRMAPDGSFVPGNPKLCPDGSWVGGDRCVQAPDGSFIGVD